MRFSERRGFSSVRVEVQRNDIDSALRNKLWTAVDLSISPGSPLATIGRLDDVAGLLWLHFFKQPLDRQPTVHFGAFTEWVRSWFYKAEWYELYDFIEALSTALPGDLKVQFGTLVNAFLEQELSAYRLINSEVAEITAEAEVKSIEEALDASSVIAPVRVHLESALSKFSQREDPDYRNSIKESISAVEALCQVLTRNRRATLGDALKRLDTAGVELHPALREAWLKMYGYTSDASGIRHALTEEPNVGSSDAKYMLVICSAFVNHLLELARASGISLRSD